MLSAIRYHLYNFQNVKNIHGGDLDSANIYRLKLNNRSTRKTCEICPKLTIKTRERCHSEIFIINFERISHLLLPFLLLTSNKQIFARDDLIWHKVFNNMDQVKFKEKSF